MTTYDLTPEQVAKELGLSVWQIRLLIRRGAIQAYDVSATPGRPTWRIRPSALATFRRNRGRRDA